MLTFLLQGVNKNWIWEACPPSKRENKIFCPPISQPVKTPSGVYNPYQKPIPLYWELMSRFSQQGDLVIEFTGGSGTLVAACCEPEFINRSGTWFTLTVV